MQEVVRTLVETPNGETVSLQSGKNAKSEVASRWIAEYLSNRLRFSCVLMRLAAHSTDYQFS